MDRVGALDADAVRLLADLEGAGDGVPMEADHDPLEILDALLLAFLDPRVDPDGVPTLNFGRSLRCCRDSTSLRRLMAISCPFVACSCG